MGSSSTSPPTSHCTGLSSGVPSVRGNETKRNKQRQTLDYDKTGAAPSGPKKQRGLLSLSCELLRAQKVLRLPVVLRRHTKLRRTVTSRRTNGAGALPTPPGKQH